MGVVKGLDQGRITGNKYVFKFDSIRSDLIDS